MFVAEIQFHLCIFKGIVVQRVIVTAGRCVCQGHARFYAALQAQIGVHVFGGPVVDHPHGSIAAANTVNASKALDNAYGIPVDVVVEHSVAVLQILPLRDTVGSNEQINFSVRAVAALACAWGKVGQDGVEVIIAESGACRVAGYHCHVQPVFFCQLCQIFVKVFRCILKGGEYQHLAVDLVVPVLRRISRLVPNVFPNSFELVISWRCDGTDLFPDRCEGLLVF